jgi:hypothetical protein
MTITSYISMVIAFLSVFQIGYNVLEACPLPNIESACIEKTASISAARAFPNIRHGTLCSIETLKLCLNFEEIHKDLLHFDILSMEFSKEKHDKTDVYRKTNEV